MSMSGGKDDGTPMMEINTTPLIDVMLVLLIMFIITIPMATHSVDVDLPADTPPPPKDAVKPDKNKVSLTRDAKIMWNDEEITDGQLVALLRQSLTLPIEPELQFEPDAEAPYTLAARVLNVIKATKVTRFGFVGNENYAYFTKD
jgi:biopolymer transport protein ExbD